MRIPNSDNMIAASELPGPWPVMVLAHNEELHIESCLDSILAADPACRLRIFVMANGCTDGTESRVQRYAERGLPVELVSIRLGDKCNAWNVFVHEVVPDRCPDAVIYFFMDGDARAVRNSFSRMALALQKEHFANAVGAPPASGRSMSHDREELVRDRGLVANLYALRGTFVRRCQQEKVRIPLGMEGDDGLIGALVRWDLNPRQDMDPRRIVPCPEAGFLFDSFEIRRPAHWIAYWKRMVRYGRRRYEFALLGPRLRAGGINAMPAHICDLYPEARDLRLSWDGVYTVTNWFALRKMREVAKTASVGR